MTVNWSPTPAVVDCGQMMSCIIPWMNTRLQDKSFVVAGPKLWNTSSVELRQPDIEHATFQLLLDIHLYLTMTQVHSELFIARACHCTVGFCYDTRCVDVNSVVTGSHLFG